MLNNWANANTKLACAGTPKFPKIIYYQWYKTKTIILIYLVVMGSFLGLGLEFYVK